MLERLSTILLLYTAVLPLALAQPNSRIDSLQNKLADVAGQEKAALLNDLSWAYIYIDLQKSRQYASDALRIAYAGQFEEISATAHRNLGATYILSGHYDSAINLYNLALSYYEREEDEQNMAKMYHDIGIIHFRKGEYADALIRYKKALLAYEKLNYRWGMPPTFSSIGDVYRYLGDYAKALDYYLQGLEIAEELKDESRIAALLNSLGLVYFREKSYEKALDFFQQGLKLSEKLGYASYSAVFFTNIADVYTEDKDYQRALEFYFKALEIEKEQQNLDGKAQSLASLGTVYDVMGKPDEAIRNFETSLALADSIGAARTFALSCNKLSGLHRKEGRLQLALSFAKKALESAKYQGFQQQIQAAYLNLAETYSLLNDYKAAYPHYVAYSAVKDSVFSENKTKQIAEMQTKYETEKKEQQIAALQMEKKNEVFRRNTYGVGLICTFAIAALIIGWLNYRIKKNKKIREQEKLLSKEKILSYRKELKQFTQNVVRKTQRIESLNRELEEVKKEIAGSCSHYDGNLDRLMQSTILTEYEWDEFKVLFEQVHRGFFSNLRSRYRDLSISEIRMAALLKLNLTSREISNMLGISHESVNKSRYRLRKKLNLSKEERLEEHFETL